jgi:DNA-binding CsgD family transcriptional regulator
MSRFDQYTVPAVPEVLPFVCPYTGLPIRTQPEWIYANPENTYRTTIALIGEHLFWVIPRGYITEADMQQAIAMAAAIKAETHPRDDPFVFIEDFGHTKGATAGARRLYLEFTNTLQGLLGSFPYGMSSFFRLSFNFSRRLHLHHYKVHMVARYEDAVTSALKMLQQHGAASVPTGSFSLSPLEEKAPPNSISASPDETVVAPEIANELTAQVDALLSHLGRLDLGGSGIPDIPDIARRSPLHPVYEALWLLKMDMDQFLDEHQTLMIVLQERQKELIAKTEAIETRNRELQALLEQSSEDQKELGAIALHNIQTLLKPLVGLIEREAELPIQRGWIDGLNARIDELTKDLTPHLDLRRYKLTPQEIRVARLVREGVRSNAIAEQLGVSVRTVESFRGRLRAKLGIRGRRRNLRTALLAIPDARSPQARRLFSDTGTEHA